MYHPWQSRRPHYEPPYDQAPWVRQMVQTSAAAAVTLRPEELAALQRLAARVQAGEYKLDRTTELTLRLLAYKGAFNRGFWSEG